MRAAKNEFSPCSSTKPAIHRGTFAVAVIKRCESRERMRMKYNKFQKSTSVPVTASESIVFMVNLANGGRKNSTMSAWAFPTRYKNEQGLVVQRGQAGLKTASGIMCQFGFNLVFGGAYRIRKSFTSNANEISRIFLGRKDDCDWHKY